MSVKYRIEIDSMGEMKVDDSKYWGNNNNNKFII